MATKSVDDILEELHNSWLDDDYDPSDPSAIEAKQCLNAYYTRECARKVLEGAEGLWQAISNAPKDSWYGTAHEYIAELHAAIQEVGGGEK